MYEGAVGGKCPMVCKWDCWPGSGEVMTGAGVPPPMAGGGSPWAAMCPWLYAGGAVGGAGLALYPPNWWIPGIPVAELYVGGGAFGNPDVCCPCVLLGCVPVVPVELTGVLGDAVGCGLEGGTVPVAGLGVWTWASAARISFSASMSFLFSSCRLKCAVARLSCILWYSSNITA